MINKLERQIIAKIGQIKENNITPADSGIGALFNSLKPKDEVLYQNLMKIYKIVLIEYKKNNLK